MGTKEKNEKLRKMNDKRFVFDWDGREDTYAEEDSLYSQRREVTLFGRGRIAGMDIREQKKQKSEYYQAVMDMRKGDGTLNEYLLSAS